MIRANQILYSQNPLNSGRSSGIRNTSNDKSIQNSSKSAINDAHNSQVKRTVMVKLNTNISVASHSLNSTSGI